MPYTPDTWANNDPTKPLNATRLTKLAGQYPQVMADLPGKIADSGDPIGAALSSTFVAVRTSDGHPLAPGTIVVITLDKTLAQITANPVADIADITFEEA